MKRQHIGIDEYIEQFPDAFARAAKYLIDTRTDGRLITAEDMIVTYGNAVCSKCGEFWLYGWSSGDQNGKCHHCFASSQPIVVDGLWCALVSTLRMTQ